MAEFSTYLPISKIDEEKRMVWGFASTPTKDLQGDVVKVSAIQKALPDYMLWANIREMHRDSAVGTTVEANTSAKGLYIGAKIVDEPAWQKCLHKVYKGFSIGGNTLKKSGDEIVELQLIEISLVDRPANPECKIDVVKAANVSAQHMPDMDAPENAIAVVAEPTRLSLIEKFLDMGQRLLGVEKAATPAVQIPPAIEETEEMVTTKEVAALAKKFNLSEGEVVKRLSAKTVEHMGKAGRAVEVAKSAHAKCMNMVSKACSSNDSLKKFFMDPIEKGDSLASQLSKMGDAHDMAEFHIGKSLHTSLGPKDGSDEEIASSNKDLIDYVDQGKLTEGEVPGTGMFAQGSPFSMSAKGAEVTKEEITALVKAATTEAVKPLETQLATLTAENAFLKGQQSVLANMPGSGRSPALFAVDKNAVITTLGTGNEVDAVNGEIAKAYGEANPNDPDSGVRAASRIIGLRAMNPGLFGKSLTDAGYKGRMGA